VAVPDHTDRPIRDLVSLAGKRAVVTGAAKGIGAAIAARLAEAGASVVLGDIDPETAESTAAAISSRYDVTTVPAHLDVSDAASIEAVADLAVTRLGGLDVWVNNAGIYPATPLLAMSDADWDRVLDVNLRGTFIGCREAARRMIAAASPGVIVNVSSVAGVSGRGPGVAHYVASKHGIVGLTRQIALEVAPHEIRVLAVAPTIIVTPGVVDSRPPDTDMTQLLTSPLGRAGLPDDVARVVLFCAGDLAAFMTGSVLLVDAGEMAR
jgi:NAD(P)-dependent dehydrogenase (short-subunit alcohol dehydrogenase family)